MTRTIYDAYGVSKTVDVGARRSIQSYNHISGGGGIENYTVAGMVNATGLTTASIVANTLYAMPLAAPRGGTIDQLAFNVTTLGALSSVKCGVYQSTTKGTNLYPGALVVDANSASSASTGVKTCTSGLPITLNSDELYWFACVCNATAPILRGLAVASCYPIFGVSSAFGTATGLGVSVAFTYANLPATFTAGGAAITAAPIPVVACRWSA